jgi:hypothetical protein
MYGSLDLAKVPHDIGTMRYSMVSSPQQANVNLFLAPLIVTQKFPKTVRDARTEYLKILEATVSALSRDKALRAVYDAGTAWVSRAIAPNYLYLYNYFRRPTQTPLRTFLAITYLRALRALIANDDSETTTVFAGLKPFLANASMVKAQADEPIQQYGPDFIGHLVVEAEARAHEDQEWAAALSNVEENFQTLEPQMSRWLEASYGKAPAKRAYDSTDTDRIAVEGEPTDAWWKVPAMVSLSCVYLRCASASQAGR